MRELFMRLTRCEGLADALAIAASIPEASYTWETGMGRTCRSDADVLLVLRDRFPEWSWRPALARTGQYSRWMITPLPNGEDPRERFYVYEGLLDAMRAFCALAEAERVVGRPISVETMEFMLCPRDWDPEDEDEEAYDALLVELRTTYSALFEGLDVAGGDPHP